MFRAVPMERGEVKWNSLAAGRHWISIELANYNLAVLADSEIHAAKVRRRVSQATQSETAWISGT